MCPLRPAATAALETLRQYLAFPFVQNALLAGLLIALATALLGVTLLPPGDSAVPGPPRRAP